MRKPDFCICKNKDADQLRGDREADQHLCFHHLASTIPLLSESEISSLQPSTVAVQPGGGKKLTGGGKKLTSQFLPRGKNGPARFCPGEKTDWGEIPACYTGLCRTWSETPKTGFLTWRLNCNGVPH